MSSASRGSRLFIPLVTTGALVAAGAGAYLRAGEPGLHNGEVREGEAEDEVVRPLALPERIDAIVVGGGPSPDANQVSLEADVRLAITTFAPAIASRSLMPSPMPLAPPVTKAVLPASASFLKMKGTSMRSPPARGRPMGCTRESSTIPRAPRAGQLRDFSILTRARRPTETTGRRPSRG